MRVLSAEFKKLKGSKIVIPMLLLPLFSVIFGSINYYGNLEVLQSEWVSLWTQTYLFYGFIFFPVLSAVYCAYSWNGEHRHNNFKLLLTAPVSHSKLLLSKISVVFFLNLFTQLYFIALFLIAGSTFNFKSEFPADFIYWLIVATIFSLVNISVQNFLSLKIKSFAIPVGLSLLIAMVSLLGSMASYSSESLKFLEYCFPSASLTVAMNHYPKILYTFKEFIVMGILSLIVFIIFYGLQKRELMRKLN
ncbi:ABC transporter permease [Anaerosphaera multitolerans]|uniref:ABC transporter permease n=1 Tax=Anaerosphaera multitolerans TaxID=2487351 RepID=A0A437S9S2_9FIRM|nr:ABC transporter permease [Anaerosphaera multitolerans]RVU55557.1 hypothetical protein EF514_02175 [Anaerosphaera multitolerans]